MRIAPIEPGTRPELAEQEAARHRKYHEESAYAKDWRVKK